MKKLLLYFIKISSAARISTLLLFMLLAGGYEVYAQTISISVSNQPLNKVFELITERSGYKFVYSDDYLKGVNNVTVNLRNADIDMVMAEVLKGTGLGYRIDGKDIVIVSPKLRQAEQQPHKEQRHISGNVRDDKGNPLIGASVRVKGSDVGAVTSLDGYFRLPIADQGATLVVSYLSMKTREISVTTQSQITIDMEYDAAMLDDVVVTAYGLLQKKEDLVGSAYQVAMESIETLPVNRLDIMLDGLVPGMTVNAQSDNGDARDRYSTRIRGETSLNAGGEPLWILDGVRLYTGGDKNAITGLNYNVSPLSFIAPNDIESITVLKDAVETSMYGADGSNGIILITTKKAKPGKPLINVSAKYGVSVIDQSTKTKVLNGSQYLTLAEEAWRNAGRNMNLFPWQDNDLNKYSTTDTDWFDYFFGIGTNLDGSVSISGGSERMRNYVSLTFHNDNPVTLGNSTTRIGGMMNNETMITRKLKFELRNNITYNINDMSSIGKDAYQNNPIFSPYYDNGDYRLIYATTEEFNVNGVATIVPYEHRFDNALAERDENIMRNRSLQIVSSGVLSYEIIDGLRLTTDFGLQMVSMYEDIYYARTNLSGMIVTRNQQEKWKIDLTPEGTSYRNQRNQLNWANTNRLDYSRSFGKHSVRGLAALEFNSNENQYIKAEGRGFPNDKMREISYSDKNKQSTSSGSGITHRMSYVGMAGYNFDRRYYIQFTYRRDGSSIFNEYTMWSDYFSVGGSWNLHNEPFFDVSFIDMFKLKASFGTTGNSRVDALMTNGSYTISDYSSYMGQAGGKMDKAPTTGVTWEKTYKTNIGLDIGLFHRFNFAVEVYNNLTTNLISFLPVSRTTGDTDIYRNMGVMRNRGIEAEISTLNIDRRDFEWRTSLNMSHNKNIILELYENIPKSFITYGYYVGYEKDIWTLIRWAGVDPRDGGPLWYDKNGNITKTYDYDNRVPWKSKTHTVYGAITNNLRWKNMTLYVQINYGIGGWARPTSAQIMDDGRNLNNVNSSTNTVVEVLDRWQKPGDLTYMPRLEDNHSMKSAMNNTRNMYNRTNFRIANTALGYSMPAAYCNRIGIRNMRLMLTIDNLYMYSLGDSKDRNSYKTMMNSFPLQRTFSLSVDLGF